MGGGCHFQNTNISLIASELYSLYDFDIKGFYGNLVKNYDFLNHTPLKECDLKDFVTKRENALLENKLNDAQAYKSIINTIMGDIGSPFNDIFDSQARFEVIQFNQVIMVNLICYLIDNGLLIFAINTDGFIIKSPTKVDNIALINNWETELCFKAKVNPLKLVVLKSNSLSLITKSGFF